VNDWVACETCKTIFEYDPVLRIAQCPYCQKPEQTAAEREKTRKAERENQPLERETGSGETDRDRVPTGRRRRA